MVSVLFAARPGSRPYVRFPIAPRPRRVFARPWLGRPCGRQPFCRNAPPRHSVRGPPRASFCTGSSAVAQRATVSTVPGRLCYPTHA
eukprot:2685697-Lingulodinium_polyedra.AAC.1